MTDKNNKIDDKVVRGYGEQARRDEAQAILDQIPYLDENFEKAVDMMYHCQGKIIVTGVGKSGHVGAKIAATLASTGTPAFYINPLDVYHGDLGVMTDKKNKIDDKVVRGYDEQALHDEAQAILAQIPYLDENFAQAVDMMYQYQ